MYTMIHTEDFKVDDAMGYDRIETGGRKHDDDDESEGAVVMRLLDRLLEKDCSKRITLEEIKVRIVIHDFSLSLLNFYPLGILKWLTTVLLHAEATLDHSRYR